MGINIYIQEKRYGMAQKEKALPGVAIAPG